MNPLRMHANTVTGESLQGRSVHRHLWRMWPNISDKQQLRRLQADRRESGILHPAGKAPSASAAGKMRASPQYGNIRSPTGKYNKNIPVPAPYVAGCPEHFHGKRLRIKEVLPYE
jgi:hypothetical protein